MGPRALFEGLDAVLWEPMPLQGCSEAEAGSWDYSKQDLFTQGFTPREPHCSLKATMVETGQICPLSPVSCGPPTLLHCPSCAEQHKGLLGYRQQVSVSICLGLTCLTRSESPSNSLDLSAHLAISSSKLGRLGSWFSVKDELWGYRLQSLVDW